MKQLTDAFGTEVKLGDYVAYSVKGSSSHSMHIGRVWKITWENGYYRLGVVSTGQRWDWNRPSGERYFFGGYKTTLSANKTLLVLQDAPQQVKDAIKAYEDKQFEKIWLD